MSKKSLGWRWDNTSDRPIGDGLCISASANDFRIVAEYLLHYAFRWPDDDLAEKSLQSRPVYDEQFRAAAQHIGLQMLGAPDCEPAIMPSYPIFRMNPDNACQTQQSLDSGVTWTTILDTSACMPTIPAFPTIPPMIRFRQHPTSPQILQQSFDGGSTWATAYDYSKYKSSTTKYVENVTYNNVVNNFNTETNNLWETSEHNINIFAPDLVPDGTPKDGDRNKAICYALRVTLHAMMETQFALTEGEGTIVDDMLGFGLGLIGTIAGGAVGTLGGPGGTVAGAAIGGILSSEGVKFLISANGDYERGVYGQYEDEYLCCMYTALKDSVPSASAFSSSLSGSCDLNSEAQTFADYLGPVLEDEQVYLSFLRLASEAVSMGKFLPDCPCEEEEPEDDCMDLTDIDNPWYPFQGPGSGWGTKTTSGLKPDVYIADGLPYLKFVLVTSAPLSSSVTFKFNQPTTNMRFTYISGITYTKTYTGPATTEIVFDNFEGAHAPNITNGAGEIWYIEGLTGGVVDSASMRIEEMCVVPAEEGTP